MTRIINDKVTVPLNGHRMRDFMEAVFGEEMRGEAKNVLKPGVSLIVYAALMQELPNWDSENTLYLAQFSGRVIVTVVEVATGYGLHVAVTQLPGGVL